MRILHVTEPFASGIVTFISQLCSELRTHEHHVYHGKRSEYNTNYEVFRLFPSATKFTHWNSVNRNLGFFNDIKAYTELKDFLSKNEFDVVHLHSSKAGFLGRRAGKKLQLNERIIYTPNGASFLRTDISVLKKLFFSGLEIIANGWGGKIVACSESEGNAFKKIGLDIDVVNNGTCFQPDLLKTSALGASNHFIIVTVGIITYQKGPKLFNQIAKIFIKHKNIRFVWVGDGPDRNLLSSPNITITGWLNKADLKKTVVDSTLYLSTSEWEGMPFSVLEAMALGRPLILSNCSGNRDLIHRNGILFNSLKSAEEAIKAILYDSDQLIRCGHQSKKNITEKFRCKETAKRYENYYQSILP